MPELAAEEARAMSFARFQRRLALVTESSSVVAKSTLLELEDAPSILFARQYPQVLTHGHFSRTNILVDQDTFEITGVLD